MEEMCATAAREEKSPPSLTSLRPCACACACACELFVGGLPPAVADDDDSSGRLAKISSPSLEARLKEATEGRDAASWGGAGLGVLEQGGGGGGVSLFGGGGGNGGAGAGAGAGGSGDTDDLSLILDVAGSELLEVRRREGRCNNTTA